MKIASLVIGISVGACSTPTKKEPIPMNQSSETTDDDQLVARVRKAAAAAVSPDSLEATVGRKALINTSAGFPIDGLRRVNLVPDPDHPSETMSLASARAVVYWARPVPGDNPHVVGVQLSVDGSASVFFG